MPVDQKQRRPPPKTGGVHQPEFRTVAEWRSYYDAQADEFRARVAAAPPAFELVPGRRVNPAVREAAELFTDGEVTPDILASVAAMNGLPLYADQEESA
jgi:hypothetical protein